jgi:RNA polymerase sigma-70 factor, ECF subfamily
VIGPEAIKYDDEVERPVIEAIQRGDAHAMNEFVHRNTQWVRSVIFGVLGRASDIDDVAQRVWLKVWREAPHLEDPSRWRPWVYRIARNSASDTGRAMKRGREALEQVADRALRAPVRTPPPDVEAAAREQQALIWEAITSLPELYREPFVLKHAEGMSYRQIGELLGLPPDTVETRLVRARRLLRERLAGKV